MRQLSLLTVQETKFRPLSFLATCHRSELLRSSCFTDLLMLMETALEAPIREVHLVSEVHGLGVCRSIKLWWLFTTGTESLRAPARRSEVSPLSLSDLVGWTVEWGRDTAIPVFVRLAKSTRSDAKVTSRQLRWVRAIPFGSIHLLSPSNFAPGISINFGIVTRLILNLLHQHSRVNLDQFDSLAIIRDRRARSAAGSASSASSRTYPQQRDDHHGCTSRRAISFLGASLGSLFGSLFEVCSKSVR